MEQWQPQMRRRFEELLEDARSDLQCELLVRTVVAGHSPSEVHAFADAIRGLSDAELFSACTMAGEAPSDFSVAQLLRAEADPLMAFEVKGGRIDPSESDASTTWGTAQASIAPAPSASTDSLAFGLSNVAKSRQRLAETAMHSLTAVTEVRRPTAQPLLQDVVEEATRDLNLDWTESDLGEGFGLSVKDALGQAASAVRLGLAVPAILGAKAGQHRRSVLLLQFTDGTGPRRVWQLYEPHLRELRWVNERDLESPGELPFSDKSVRVLTRIILPQIPRALRERWEACR
jgi:hypothetical protein